MIFLFLGSLRLNMFVNKFVNTVNNTSWEKNFTQSLSELEMISNNTSNINVANLVFEVTIGAVFLVYAAYLWWRRRVEQARIASFAPQ